MVQFSHAPRTYQALAALRIIAALFLIVHGVARVALGIVDDFGGFLGEVGLPFGTFVAGCITVFEIAGGAYLAMGRLVRPLALGFAAELAVGIALVHAPEGWFVVGAGRNGMEYSALLIAVLIAVAYAAGPPSAHMRSDAMSHSP
ncbi:DoxX family protein [Rubrivirga sp. IMCC43871]|uniref:DoxX family protein n=1 Tax=Rubrivirga sp. IMCC43871 TaxID=3391575 RepID=UPI00398FA25B